MAERTLRGARLGGQSFEDERGIEFAARQQVGYRCPQGHDFEITMSDEAEIPAVWECPRCGDEALSTAGIEKVVKAEKPVRTHWDMLLERRSEKELEDILKERLELLRDGRDRPGAPAPRQRAQAQGLRLTVSTYRGRPPRPGPPGRRRAWFLLPGGGMTTSRRATTVVSSRRATGRVSGRISRIPNGVGDEAGRQHQRAADQDQRAVGELPGRHPAAAQGRLQGPPGPAALPPDEPGAQDAVGDQEQDRPPDADDLADLDEDVDLDQRAPR